MKIETRKLEDDEVVGPSDLVATYVKGGAHARVIPGGIYSEMEVADARHIRRKSVASFTGIDLHDIEVAIFRPSVSGEVDF